MHVYPFPIHSFSQFVLHRRFLPAQQVCCNPLSNFLQQIPTRQPFHHVVVAFHHRRWVSIFMIPLAKKFRYAGIAPELEEKLDSMFNQVVATGGNVWIPSMGAMPSLFADEVVMIDEDNNIGHGDDILDSPTKVKVPKKIGKRKKSEKDTKQEILSRMDDLVESSRSVSSRITTPVVPPSLLLLEEAVDEIEKHEEIYGDPAFYDFATVFLLTTVNRGMFLKLPLHKRVTWLRNRFNQSTGRSG